jgi:signal transduction histidine kinase
VAIAVVAENLLSNAVQASPNHGSIEVQIMTEPGYVVCSIRDPGPGMTKELQDRLLRRVSATGTIAPDSQTGLGVRVANEFVGRMDGDLWCESEPGRGARFSFRLPAIE